MTDRREFLQATAFIGLSAIAGATRSVNAARTSAPLRTDLHALLVDECHAECQSVGAALETTGLALHAIRDGDITVVWLRDVAPLWRDRRAAIGGLTTRATLFCLEQLAVTHGLRVLFHGEHFMYPGGHVEHCLMRGAGNGHLSVHDLKLAGALWPHRLAAALATYRRSTRQRPGPSMAALQPHLPPDTRLLTSWIIGPA